jgi:hypothetical protein
MKQLVVILNCFCLVWMQSAPAFAAAAQNEAIKDFLQRSHLSKNEVSINEIYKLLKSNLDPKFATELQKNLKSLGNIKVPVVSTSKVVGPNGEEQVQLQMVKKNESAIFTIVDKGEHYATLSGSYKGKDYSVKVTHQDMANGMAFLDKLTNEIAGESSSQNIPKVFLSKKNFSKLNPNARKKYQEQVQKLLEEMENLSRIRAMSFSNDVSWMDLFVERAYAAESFECVVGGYVGMAHPPKYECAISNPDDRATAWDRNAKCAPAAIQCNPMIYGAGICVQGSDRQKQTAKYDTTSLCNHYVASENESGRKAGIAAFDGTGKEVDAQHMHLMQALEKMWHACGEGNGKMPKASQSKMITNSKGEKESINDQFFNTCKALGERIRAISDVACDDFKNDKTGAWADLQCDKVTIGKTEDPKKPDEPKPEPAKPEVESDKQCIGLNDWFKMGPPRVECGEENKAHLVASCKNDRTYWECECGSKFQKVNNGPLTVGCKEKPLADRRDGTHFPSRGDKEKPSWQIFGDATLPLVGGLVGLMLWNYSMKQSQKTYFNMMTTATNPLVPPPSLPPPSNNNLPPPGGTR